MLKDGLERLWTYRYEGAMFRYPQSWIARLRWQRLPAFDRLAAMLVAHLDGLLDHCRTPVRFGVVEAINGNIKALLRRGRGYTNLRYLLLKAQRIAGRERHCRLQCPVAQQRQHAGDQTEQADGGRGKWRDPLGEQRVAGPDEGRAQRRQVTP